MQAGSKISAAAEQVHVSRGTYYYWRRRYEAAGEAGLAAVGSHAPQRPRLAPLAAEIQAEVIVYAQSQPQAGYMRIAQGVNKAHNWERVVSASSVRKILWREGLRGPTPAAGPEVASAPAAAPVVYAERAGQTIHVDLCVVPVSHAAANELCSVSLSAAQQGAEPVTASVESSAPAVSSYPGAVFADSSRSYEEQMRAYQEQRTQKRRSQGARKHRRTQKQAQRRQVHEATDELRIRRRRQRQQRRQQDAQWQAHKAQRRRQRSQRSSASRSERRQQEQAWQELRQQRHQQQAQRQQEDAQWRQARQALLTQLATLAELPVTSSLWFAILVIVDNGTRQCLGLPLFLAGTHVTAQMVVDALRPLLPPHLQFLISDNGPHFIAELFQHLARDQEFLHIRIAPHHPATNGIAERFVLTLKQWLQTHSWDNDAQLQDLLRQFIDFYNDRPHQAPRLNGLSPNEFRRRLDSCSTS